MSEKVCSRCNVGHSGKYDTCDMCRAENNARKMIYHLSRLWDVDPDTVRIGLRKALQIEKP